MKKYIFLEPNANTDSEASVLTYLLVTKECELFFDNPNNNDNLS